MDQVKRDEEIYARKTSGATYAEIAKMFDISNARVQQLYFRIKDRKENYDSWPPLKKLLTNRTQMILHGNFAGENILENPQKLVALGASELLKMKHIGIITIRELAAALEKLGLIKDSYEWLKCTMMPQITNQSCRHNNRHRCLWCGKEF